MARQGKKECKVVTLVRRVKTKKGWRRFDVVFSDNGRVRHEMVYVPVPAGDAKKLGATKVGNKYFIEEKHPEGAYELRHYEGGQPVYDPVGNNPTEAKKALTQAHNESLAMTANEKAGIEVTLVEPGDATLEAWAAKLIEKKTDLGVTVMAASIKEATDQWLTMLPKGITPEEITAVHLETYIGNMLKAGYAKRTIHNRFARLIGVLKFAKVPFSTEMLELRAPKCEKKLVEFYKKPEREAFFAACESDREIMIFNTALQMGLREQELMFLEPWEVDFDLMTVTIHSKTREGFLIKDKEERTLPLTKNLADILKNYLAANPKLKWFSQDEHGQPDRYLLKLAKKIGKRAGLKCRVFLHKFRATYATQLLRDRVDIRTVSKLMGHSNIETTMIYLRAIEAEDKELQTKINQVNF